MNITKLSIERPVVLIVVFSLLMIMGIFSYLQLNYELVPKFNPPVITVVTIYPGAQAKEVENDISIPIENALSALPNIDVITSTSRDNFSLVKLEMKSGTPVEPSLNEASRKLLSITRDLPGAAEPPVLTRFDFNDLPIIRLSAFSDLSALGMSEFCRDEVIPKLSQLPGIADIKLLGSVEQEVVVNVSKARLAQTHTTILQVLQAVGKGNVRVPAGDVSSESIELSAVFQSKFQSLDALRNVVIFENEKYNIVVRLKDVADVQMIESQPETISRLNGQSAVSMEIKKTADANAVEVSRAVIKELDLLEKQYSGQQLQFEIAQDTSVFTLQAAKSVTEDLMLAVVLVSIVMLVFLHSLRNALIVFIAIPTSILSTFVIMSLLGYSLNLLTLLGLSLAIGILVDDSIVVIENIYRHLTMGKKAPEAALIGRMEIGFAAVSITLIDVVVFLPIVFTQGMVSDLLRQFSVVIVASTLMSLLVSFTLVPYFASRLHKRFSGTQKNFAIFRRLDEGLDSFVGQITALLKWSFRFPWVVGFVIISLLAGSIGLIIGGWIGIEFTKAGDRSEFIVELSFKPGTPLNLTDQFTQKAENLALAYPGVQSVFTSVGTTSSGRIVSNSSHLSEMYVQLVDKSHRTYKTSEFARHLKYHLMEEIPGLDARPIEINIIGLRDDDAVQFTILTKNDSLGTQVATDLTELLDQIPGTIEVQSSLSSGTASLVITPERSRMEALNLEPARVGGALRTMINGHDDFSFSNADQEVPILIRLQRQDIQSVADLKAISLLNAKGNHVALDQFAQVEDQSLPDQLERTNRINSISVKSQVFGRPGGSVGREFRKAVEKYGLPNDVSILYGGATKRTQEGLVSMAGALAVSILLVYSILAVLYNSFTYPLVILFSIPLAIIGAFLALALSGEALSIFSIMGLIILSGLVGKNAILVVDFTNNLRKQGGYGIQEALLKATELRFRPILMTNLTMIVGLLPIALSAGAGSEWKNGLAWALIGGLSSSMFLSLIVVPLIYQSLENVISKIGRRSR